VKGQSDARKERLASALRENLKRRKARARALSGKEAATARPAVAKTKGMPAK
jgi:hypothetical protein